MTRQEIHTVGHVTSAPDELPCTALCTVETVTAVPSGTDAVTDLIDGLVLRDCNDVADNLVSGNTREASRVSLTGDDCVAV